MKNYRAIFLSPHFDDAVLSCGGEIDQLRKEGPVLVVTIFGGGKEKYLQINRRIEEEKRAAAILNYDFEIWDFLDAIHRSLLNHLQIFRHRSLKKIPQFFPTLAASMKALDQNFNSPVYYAPLGVGNHIDHQLTKLAVSQALPKNKLCFYEEIPYAFEKKIFFGGLVQQNKTVPDWDKKVKAVLAYQSQSGPIKKFLKKKEMKERFWVCRS